MDVHARGFKHEEFVALPLSHTASVDETDNLVWSGRKMQTSFLQPPQRKGANPLRTALQRVLSSEDPSVAAQIMADESLPRRWEKLGDCVLFAPRGIFADDTAASTALSSLSTAAQNKVFAAIAASLGARRLGVQGVIEESLHRKSTARLLFPMDCKDGLVEHRENGIIYSFDVTRNMFSSGNGTEKARVSTFRCDGQTVVDLFAGIGYFTLPYLVHAQAAHLHACEWDDDALHALRNNLHANGVAERCTVHPGDNAFAATAIGSASGVSGGRIAHHVNLGLIPSSEAAWGVALSVLRPEGGWLHVHANVPSDLTGEAEYCNSLKARLAELAVTVAGRAAEYSNVAVEHVERVKSYAPKINHVVIDVRVGKSTSIATVPMEDNRMHPDRGAAGDAPPLNSCPPSCPPSPSQEEADGDPAEDNLHQVDAQSSVSKPSIASVDTTAGGLPGNRIVVELIEYKGAWFSQRVGSSSNKEVLFIRKSSMRDKSQWPALAAGKRVSLMIRSVAGRGIVTDAVLEQ